jgi:hypothetical protein
VETEEQVTLELVKMDSFTLHKISRYVSKVKSLLSRGQNVLDENSNENGKVKRPREVEVEFSEGRVLRKLDESNN